MYSGYNQIKKHTRDQQHTLFVINCDLYCYTIMPFSLKMHKLLINDLSTRCFRIKLENTMEVYIDDMLVKSIKVDDHISNMNNMF